MAVQGQMESFDPAFPELWETYAERVEFFLEAKGISEVTLKRATLLSMCGAATFELAQSLVAPRELRTTSYEEIMGLLKNHFSPQPSRIARRYAFYKRDQAVGEAIAVYVAALRQLARRCEFNNLEEMILDRVICGLSNRKLQQKLFAMEGVTFQGAIKECLSFERAEGAVKQFRQSHPSPTPAVNSCEETALAGIGREEVLQTHREGRRHNAPALQPRLRQEVQTFNPSPCASCGGAHERQNCYYKNFKCKKCSKLGHLGRVCRSKSARGSIREFGGSSNEIHQGSTLQELYTTSVYPVQSINLITKEKIYASVEIQGSLCRMEVDSGSAFSIISVDTYKRLCPRNGPKLNTAGLVLTDFQGNRVCIRGVGKFRVCYKGFDGLLDLIVVEGRRTSLLGLAWFEPLGIQVTGVQNMGQQDVEAVCKEFAQVFEKSLGCYTGPPVSLQLNPAIAPIRMKARRVPFALKPKIEEALDRLTEQGVLEPVSHARWETPIVTPLKPNGDVRICADYKCTINKALQQHAYPVPVVSHLLTSLAGSKVFGKLDLAQAYQQLPVSEDTAEAQTIVTHRGAFRVKRLQFGVSVAPGIFQNLMDTLLKGIPGVIPFFDDVLIAGASESEFTHRLREVLQRFQSVGLKVKKEKCTLGVPKVEFLGYLIDAEGVHPSPGKVQAIVNAPPPRSKQELQAFLGLLNFYHSFLPHKAAVAEPLHRLLDKGAPWGWGQLQDAAFQAVKKLLTSNSLLAHFDESLPVVLACDASPYGIGAVLSHRLQDGREAPVAYYSRTLSATERNYAQIDKEALAIVAGVKKFHDYLYGRCFSIVTDHKPLLGLFAPDKQTPQILSPRMMRWSIFLSAYQYSLYYRPGKAIGHADALSRLPLPMSGPDPAPAYGIMLLESLPEPPLHASMVASYSAKDRVLSRVLNWVWRGWPGGHVEAEFKAYVTRQNELSAHKGCLLWGSRVVIPPKLRNQVLEALHENHPGIVRMKALARSYVWWPGIDAAIEEWVHQCRLCQESRPEVPRAPVQHWETTRNPWSRVHIDFAGPFQGQNFFLLVDSYTKWLEVVPVSVMTSRAVVRALRRIFATHGLPDTIVSDNAAQFMSAEFKEFIGRYLIRHVTSAPFHPSTNGQVERMVRTTKESLARIVYGDWDHRLAAFLFSHRVTPGTTTGRSPAELLMGRRLTTRLDRLHPDRTTDRLPVAETQEPVRSFSPDDLVYVRNYASGPRWIPATVCRATGPVSYEVVISDGRVFRRHLDQMRRRVSDPAPVLFPPVPREQQQEVPGAEASQDVTSQEGEFCLAPPGLVDARVPIENPPVENELVPENIPVSIPVQNPETGVPVSGLRRSVRERTRPRHLEDYVC